MFKQKSFYNCRSFLSFILLEIRPHLGRALRLQLLQILQYLHPLHSLYILVKFLNLSKLEDQKNKDLVAAMRHYDYTVNITWVIAHFNAAKHYILATSGDGEATGGSKWQKYMHPKYQKRIFFPELWTSEEIENWGKNLD